MSTRERHLYGTWKSIWVATIRGGVAIKWRLGIPRAIAVAVASNGTTTYGLPSKCSAAAPWAFVCNVSNLPNWTLLRWRHLHIARFSTYPVCPFPLAYAAERADRPLTALPSNVRGNRDRYAHYVTSEDIAVNVGPDILPRGRGGQPHTGEAVWDMFVANAGASDWRVGELMVRATAASLQLRITVVTDDASLSYRTSYFPIGLPSAVVHVAYVDRVHYVPLHPINQRSETNVAPPSTVTPPTSAVSQQHDRGAWRALVHHISEQRRKEARRQLKSTRFSPSSAARSDSSRTIPDSPTDGLRAGAIQTDQSSAVDDQRIHNRAVGSHVRHLATTALTVVHDTSVFSCNTAISPDRFAHLTNVANSILCPHETSRRVSSTSAASPFVLRVRKRASSSSVNVDPPPKRQHFDNG